MTESRSFTIVSLIYLNRKYNSLKIRMNLLKMLNFKTLVRQNKESNENHNLGHKIALFTFYSSVALHSKSKQNMILQSFTMRWYNIASTYSDDVTSRTQIIWCISHSLLGWAFHPPPCKSVTPFEFQNNTSSWFRNKNTTRTFPRTLALSTVFSFHMYRVRLEAPWHSHYKLIQINFPVVKTQVRPTKQKFQEYP